MTNSSQSVTASLTLSAFGQTVASTGSSTSAYQFGATSGYRTEGDAGLTLVGCRFYDVQVGRFITRDTVLTEKPYAYCEGDPVNAVDPSGHGMSSLDGSPEDVELAADCMADINGGGSIPPASELQPTQTVLNNVSTRPYINSPITTQSIMDSRPPVPDPGGIPGGLRWDAPGSFRGSPGTFQLVVDTVKKTIVHFLFSH